MEQILHGVVFYLNVYSFEAWLVSAEKPNLQCTSMDNLDWHFCKLRISFYFSRQAKDFSSQHIKFFKVHHIIEYHTLN